MKKDLILAGAIIVGFGVVGYAIVKGLEAAGGEVEGGLSSLGAGIQGGAQAVVSIPSAIFNYFGSLFNGGNGQ